MSEEPVGSSGVPAAYRFCSLSVFGCWGVGIEGPGMDFLTKVFGDHAGYLCVVTIQGNKHVHHFFDYPGDLKCLSARLGEWSGRKGTNVYFFPVLVEEPDMDSDIICTPVIAADLDMVDPVLVSPTPSLIVESSPGRFQAYWFRNGHSDEFTPGSVNGSIVGDIKLKRIPGTRNWKYSDNAWMVREVEPGSLDTFEKVASRRNLIGDSFTYLFRTSDRWSLARLCARLGCSVTESYLVLAAAQTAAGTSPGDDGYVSAGVLYQDAVEAVRASSVPCLLTDDEIRAVADRTDSGESFVDRYVEWAASCTDSPRQYHVAGALTVLSTLLSPHIRLETSFGEFRCNLWFMILASTTMTRKTTAMEMAVKLAKCIDPDIVLTTNGPQEGIIAALEDRDGRSSLFHRDEISGFLAETAEKRYMTGILETLTRLYDGGSERKTLSRRVIEINDPYFMILCGGIKSKTIELLDVEHIMSGFLPRFLIVCGWTRKEDMKPIGPPNQSVPGMRNGLIGYLEGMVKRYVPQRPAMNGQVRRPLAVEATDDAWSRMRQLEDDVHELGIRSDNPDIFSPLYERCKNSIIKVAILLAADRAYREKAKPVLDVRDLLVAISYAGVWIESMHEVAHGIDDKPTRDELRIIRIESTIRERAEGITRSDLMRKYRLSAREANEIEATLIGRGLVVGSSVNKATVYRAATRET